MTSLPTINDYLQAVQNPKTAFRDPILQDGKITLQPDGKPSVWSGISAVVFKITTADGEKALRCFTYVVSDRRERYYRLTSYLQGKPSSSLVSFKYYDYAVLVGNAWYPVVEMQWVDGEPLDKYIERCIRHDNRQALQLLASKWKQITEELPNLEVAHGNLNHTDVLVLPNGDIRLIDYDSMFVPALSGMISIEIGHRNYQHPQRANTFFNFKVDHFSMQVIYLSIKSLAVLPDLWLKYHKDDQLIFSQSDFLSPDSSPLFGELKNCGDSLIMDSVQDLEVYCNSPMDDSPSFFGTPTRIPIPALPPSPPVPFSMHPVKSAEIPVIPIPVRQMAMPLSPLLAKPAMTPSLPPIKPVAVSSPPLAIASLPDKKTKGIFATIASVLLCGCPGMFLCIMGISTSAELSGQTGVIPPILGLVFICLSAIFMLIPIVLVFFALR